MSYSEMLAMAALRNAPPPQTDAEAANVLLQLHNALDLQQNVGAGGSNAFAQPVVRFEPRTVQRPSGGSFPGLTFLDRSTNMVGPETARAEVLTDPFGPALPTNQPAAVLEARASPAAAPPPVAAVSFGLRDPTTGSQPASAELLKLTVQTPKLTIDEKTDAKAIPVRAKAFVRDVLRVFALVPWGGNDAACCLFLSQAMVGIAKTWFDTWSLAKKTYTAQEVLVQVLRRFAPQIQSLEEDARQKLSSLSYRMLSGETVVSYQSRFEALITDVPLMTEGERLFAFRRGLSEALATACAVDRSPALERPRTT